MTLEECLRGHPTLQALDADDFNALASAIDEKSFADGFTFIRQGEHADQVYFLLDGEVEVEVRKPEQADFSARHRMKAGEIIGLVALVDGGPRSASCTAKGDIRVGAFGLDGARLLMESRAPISCAFQVALAKQLVKDARALNHALVAALRERLCR